MELTSQIEKFCLDATKEITSASTLEEINRARVKYLGREGQIRQLFSLVSRLPTDQKRTTGDKLNRIKQELEKILEQKYEKIKTHEQKLKPREFFDVTLPGIKQIVGRKHPVYRTMQEIQDIFVRLGFDVVYGPEIESEYNNFEALNIPTQHPSRDAWDTFYLDKNTVLRSHTSPVQIRAMLERKPPFRLIAPGKVFRPDTVNASHLNMFHQVEGLMVGEDVTMAHLKTILNMFAVMMFGEGSMLRFRPSFFPFTEPSAEVDMSCVICQGKGCQTCGSTGWIEILGAGMVHPKVFENVGYDPEKHTGFAFGMGVERIAMLKYGINDIRLFLENQKQFLDQFY